MQDNLQGQLTILKSQLEELAISFSDILMPTIRAIVSKIQAFADKLNSLSPEMKETVVKIALIVAVIGPALIAFTNSVMEKIKTALEQAWEVISESVKNFMETIFTTITDVWNQAGATVRTALENIRNIVTESWTGISEIISSALSGVQACVTTARS